MSQEFAALPPQQHNNDTIHLNNSASSSAANGNSNHNRVSSKSVGATNYRQNQKSGQNGVISSSQPQKDGISVVLRVRPLNTTEIDNREKTSVNFLGNGQIAISSQNSNRIYNFNVVFEPEANQSDLFENSGLKRLIEMAKNGYSCTCLAYGQTGSGKTYTISGPPSEFLLKARPQPQTFGIMPRAFFYLFHLLQQDPVTSYRVCVSYLEIYNEQIVDLLNPHPMYPLNVRWRKDKGFFVDNLFYIECDTIDDLMGVLEVGMKQRSFNPTNPNEFSSRSHTLLTIRINSEILDPYDSSIVYTKQGKLIFVDLAGSEKAKSGPEITFEQLQETNNINRSLLVLGNCISSLGDPKRRNTHIPFRDSKLTKLLADSLGGNGVTLMIACISPAASAVTETGNTLRYASRALNIENKPTVKIDPREELIGNLKKEINMLKNENRLLKSNGIPKHPPNHILPPNHVSNSSLPSTSVTVDVGSGSLMLSGNDDSSSQATLKNEDEELILLEKETPKKINESEAAVVVTPTNAAAPPVNKKNSMETSHSREAEVNQTLYEMLQEYMVENESLRKDNSNLHKFKAKINREQEMLSKENETLTKQMELLMRKMRVQEQEMKKLQTELKRAGIVVGATSNPTTASSSVSVSNQQSGPHLPPGTSGSAYSSNALSAVNMPHNATATSASTSQDNSYLKKHQQLTERSNNQQNHLQQQTAKASYRQAPNSSDENSPRKLAPIKNAAKTQSALSDNINSNPVDYNRQIRKDIEKLENVIQEQSRLNKLNNDLENLSRTHK